MKLLQKAAIVFFAVCIAFPIFANGSSDDKAAETELNAYSIMPEKYATPILAEFTKDTGIKVNFVRLSSGEALSRIIAEKGNPQVDCLWGGPSDTYDAGVAEGVFEQYKPAEADKIPANYRSPDNYWTGIGIIPLCFLTVGVQTAVNAGAGIVRMSWKKYTLAMIPGCIAWSIMYGLGMLAVWMAVVRAAAGSVWGWLGLAAIAAIITAVVLMKRRRGREQRHAELTQEVAK